MTVLLAINAAVQGLGHTKRVYVQVHCMPLGRLRGTTKIKTKIERHLAATNVFCVILMYMYYVRGKQQLGFWACPTREIFLKRSKNNRSIYSLTSNII